MLAPMSTPDQPPRPTGSGRLLMILGLALAFSGPFLYLLQLRLGRLETPWYAPALAVLGVFLVLLSLRRRFTIVRVLALAVALLLAGLQGWFFASYSRLPAYAGPARAGEPFPAFEPVRAAGQPLTRTDLEGDRATVVVFFRGRW